MTENTAPPKAHRHPGSSRGLWTIVAIFAVGLTVMAGLYLSPRSRAPTVPAGISSGLPPKPLKGVLLDCRPLGASPAAVVAAIKKLSESPDLLFLIDIESPLVPAVIEAFGMQPSYHAELFQRAQPNLSGGEKIGICILSKHPLFEGTPIRVDRRTVGVETIMVAEGHALHVRCIALDDAPVPAGAAVHPKALQGGPPPVLLTAGRLAGAWKIELSQDGKPTGEVVETARYEAPVAVVFNMKRAPEQSGR